MLGFTRRARLGLVALGAVVATSGLLLGPGQTATAEAQQCYERFVGAPIAERGIQCPGEPTIWKSYTYSTNDFGYYTQTYHFEGGRSQVRLGYKHRDGRVAISYTDCDPGGCKESYWNGVEFPFGH